MKAPTCGVPLVRIVDACRPTNVISCDDECGLGLLAGSRGWRINFSSDGAGRRELPRLDPFLMLDEFKVTSPGGFPPHPHRGQSTVTYMISGAFEHEDFKGHKGTIGPGDLQWYVLAFTRPHNKSHVRVDS